MDDSGSPALEVGFAIDTLGSFDSLSRLEARMDAVSENVISEIAKVEKASRNIVSFGGATLEVATFGNTMTKGAREAARELARVEKSGEALARQLDRQASTFGKSREELRRMKVETAALAAEQKGLTELAGRLRAAESSLFDQEYAASRRARAEAQALAEDKAMAAQRAVTAAENEAKAIREAAWAHQMFEAKVREGTRAMLDQAAAEAEAAARKTDLEVRTRRLINSIDPAAAAQERYNREMLEARSLVSAGAITLDHYSAKLRQEQSTLDAATVAIKRNSASAGAHRMAMQGASYQVQDFITQVSMGANPINAFSVQGAQLAGQFSQIEGRAGSVARFFMGPWGLALTGALMLVGMMTDGLFKGANAAKTKAKEAKDLTDAINSLAEATRRSTQSEQANMAAVLDSAKAYRQKALDTRAATVEQIKLAQAYVKANLAQQNRFDGRGDGGFAAGGGSGVAAAIGMSRLRELEAQLALNEKQLEKTQVAFREAQIPIMLQSVAEKTDEAARATGRFDRAMDALNRQYGAGGLSQDAYTARATELRNAHDAAQKAIEDSRKAETSSAREAGQETRRLERLGRENDAVEAQIANLHRLTDAYRLSGGEAVIAAARVKAESDAIRQRADSAIVIDRQVRLAIAERVSGAAQSTAALHEQALAQEHVNGQVLAGLIPAERAADLVRDRIADLPLLAAIEAAQQRGLTKETQAATKALEDQAAARERNRVAQATAQFNAATAAGNNRIAELNEEIRLIGASDAERIKAIATLKAEQEAQGWSTAQRNAHISQQVELANLEHQNRLLADAHNESLRYRGDLLEAAANNASNAARGMADAFGDAGAALGGLASTFADYLVDQERMNSAKAAQLALVAQIDKAEVRARRENEINSVFAMRALTSQIGLFGDLTSTAKGFFKTGSTGYKTLESAEKAFRAVEFALSVRAMAQDAIETASAIAQSGFRAGKYAVEAVAKAISSMPFPMNLAAGAATAAALAAIGISIAGSFGGGKGSIEKPNEGTGTVFGDSAAKSESIKRAIDSLKEVDTLTNGYAREMMASLRSIDSQIGGFAALVVRTGNINASGGVNTGFKADATGKVLEGIITGGGVLSKIPIVGGIVGAIGSVVKSLFGSKTSVVGSGLYGGAQSLESILNGGFDASYYSDVKKKKKFLGVTTGTSYSTQYANADAGLENQFTLILREFNAAITAAAGPLGVATDEVQTRLKRFVVNIGKIDLQGLTGAQIEEKLTAVFGAAADNMANAAFPGMAKFQKVGEGTFETLVRVASIVEAVTASFDMLGFAATGMSIETKMALSDQFESVSAMLSATQSYFAGYYTPAEQAAAKTAEFAKVFGSLNLAMPSSLTGFRALVEAQDLTTDAGRKAYATLIQLAPAFADLQSAMVGAKSAADILSERQDLERRLLELQGDTAAIRALDLAKLDGSNRALQEQIYALQDAQAAAKAADELRKAWTSVGDSIMDEVKRIRGLTGGGEEGGFAALMGQFNAATAAARGGDQEMAKALPGLSQALLRSASLAATSKQELDRVQAQTAASLEATYAAISARGNSPATGTDTLTAAATAAQANNPAGGASATDLAAETRALREELKKMREENNAGHAATAGNTGAVKRVLENVTTASGGDAISTVLAA